jgi:hypothetical protein
MLRQPIIWICGLGNNYNFGPQRTVHLALELGEVFGQSKRRNTREPYSTCTPIPQVLPGQFSNSICCKPVVAYDE